MFDFVHENKRLVQIVLALIILPFAFWGVDSYNRSGKSADVVATVNDTKITQQEFDNALRQQQDRLRQQFGDRFDAAMLDNPGMKRAVMDNLVMQHLLFERAKTAKLFVTDEQIAQVVGGVEAFQNDGKFDKKRYEAVLKNQNMSPLMFEARMRDRLFGQQIQDAYAQNGFASNQVVDRIIRLNEQQRVVSVSSISAQSFMAQAKVDEEALARYYEQNKKEFQVKEQAKVEYVKFSMNDLLTKVEISKEDVRKYFDEHQSDFGTQEERQAAHILISASAAATQAEHDAARAKAGELLQQVKQNPGKFAELAKLNSQDVGSAQNGGDLGFFGRGMMVKPFEDAVFSLKAGEISGLVKSDFGYHIIKLISVKSSRVLPFDEAREDIANKLRQQKAADMYAELADKFSNTVYEQSDTLKPAAELVNAKIEQSGWLSTGMVTAEPWTAKMLQAIFTDEVVKNKRNTAAIEVTGDTLVAARILEYKPAAERALSEVQEVIRQKLSHQQAAELAAKQGNAMLEQLRNGSNLKLNWNAAETITQGKHGSLDAGLARQVFQANAAKLPQYVGAEVAQNGYMLVRIDAIKEVDEINDEKRASYAQQLRKLTGEEMFQAYLTEAKRQAVIEINLPETATIQP
ncbi:MAG: peptidylprolyl isomerase [Gallionellales bacterium RIFCSPLOWO2_12_FULL_57_18]|nr:MAG: peptidylprolyl isomerase [Gallionellales bacterium RIFCSPLOWO2_02_FULL_57_47]OGS94486.1 MAG: peptidylprolyl isomerase [Gallionellales bacterium RIFCSPLOWO2_12_FULL_57_18]